MIRIYCDLCEKEMPATNDQAVFEIKNIQINAMILVNNIYHAGQVCIDCVRRIVNEGKRIK